MAAHVQYQTCIESCKKAVAACLACIKACKSEGHSAMMQRCIALDTDCAEFCQLAVKSMERDSEFVALICEDCAEICQVCSEECSKHSEQHCQDCAKATKACMEECLRVISH
jgi:hypothetical protein